MRDYLAIVRPKKSDALQFGIRGMKWGVRRTDAQLARDTASRKAAGEEVTPTKKAESVQSGPETAAQKYSRLHGEAKGGGQSNWSQEDLNFYNSRTDAINKVNKMFQEDPGWLKSTTDTVIKKAAQRTMQDIANGITKKYISDKLLDSLSDNTKAIEAESSTPIDYVGRHRAKKK